MAGNRLRHEVGLQLLWVDREAPWSRMKGSNDLADNGIYVILTLGTETICSPALASSWTFQTSLLCTTRPHKSDRGSQLGISEEGQYRDRGDYLGRPPT